MPLLDSQRLHCAQNINRRFCFGHGMGMVRETIAGGKIALPPDPAVAGEPYPAASSNPHKKSEHSAGF